MTRHDFHANVGVCSAGRHQVIERSESVTFPGKDDFFPVPRDARLSQGARETCRSISRYVGSINPPPPSHRRHTDVFRFILTAVSVEEISMGARDLHTGLEKIRRDLESRFLDINDGYSKRMFPFSANAEGRVEALRDQVQAGIRAFNEVKMYYGEGDEKYNATTNPLVLGRPGSLEFFGVFKTFLTSYDVSQRLFATGPER